MILSKYWVVVYCKQTPRHRVGPGHLETQDWKPEITTVVSLRHKRSETFVRQMNEFIDLDVREVKPLEQWR